MSIPWRRNGQIWLALSLGAFFLSPPALAQEDEALPPEARVILEELLQKEREAQNRLEQKLRPLREASERELLPARQAAARMLRALQDRLTRAGALDEALAVREAVRRALGILPDPGVLHLTEADIGKTMIFEVRGSTQGSVWGSEVYTADSHLGTAAVHAGVLKPGQKGLVRVRVLGGQQKYMGSTLRGVTTQPYGPWPVSFTIEPEKLEQ